MRGEGREKERVRNIDVQEKQQLVASLTPPTGDLVHNPAMCPCAPTGNQTSDPLVHRPTLIPLSHTSQGKMLCFNLKD